EPTTALDVTVQAQVISTLMLAKERTGAAMLFITHDLSLVAGIADRVVVMHDSEVVEEADVYTIFDSLREEYRRNHLSFDTPIHAHVRPRSPRIRKILASS